MTKLEDKVNEILGIDSKPEAENHIVKQEIKPPVPRKEDVKKPDVDND